ncbi:unnamed protein product, partial [Vitis vinifera]
MTTNPSKPIFYNWLLTLFSKLLHIPRSRKIQNPSGRTPSLIYRTETPKIEKSETPIEEAPVSFSEKKNRH